MGPRKIRCAEDAATSGRTVKSGRRDLGLQFEEFRQVEVGDERVSLATGLPQRDAEAPNYPRAEARREGEPVVPDDEERSRVLPSLVDEYRRSPIEKRLHGPALQREVVASGESNGGREVELAA